MDQKLVIHRITTLYGSVMLLGHSFRARISIGLTPAPDTCNIVRQCDRAVFWFASGLLMRCAGREAVRPRMSAVSFLTRARGMVRRLRGLYIRL